VKSEGLICFGSERNGNPGKRRALRSCSRQWATIQALPRAQRQWGYTRLAFGTGIPQEGKDGVRHPRSRLSRSSTRSTTTPAINSNAAVFTLRVQQAPSAVARPRHAQAGMAVHSRWALHPFPLREPHETLLVIATILTTFQRLRSTRVSLGPRRIFILPPSLLIQVDLRSNRSSGFHSTL